MTDESGPGIAPTHDCQSAYSGIDARHNSAASRHPSEPQRQPDEASHAKYEEDGPPTEMRDEEAAEQCSKSWSALCAGVDAGICKSTLMFDEMFREDLGIAWIGDRFSHSEHQLQYHETAETSRHAGSALRKRPEEKPCRQNPLHRKSINYPAGENLKRRIRPKE